MDDRDWFVTPCANGDFKVSYVQTDIPEQEITYNSFVEVDEVMYYEDDVKELVSDVERLTRQKEALLMALKQITMITGRFKITTTTDYAL